ncbi:MAG: hypothetical protein CK541_06835 [Opitutia bacterium]|nr:MAG: hypothetical protein CK541_06835 [Opitutae bacterium]
MSQEETPGQEPVSPHQPAADAGANEVRTPAPRLNEAKLESAHAELPPLSVIGASSEPAAKPGTITTPKQFGRRGTPRGAAPSAANGQAARPSIGVVEDPSQLTENLSGDRAQPPAQGQRERREPRPEGERGPRREPRAPRPEGFAEEGRQPGIPQGDRPFREPRAEGDRGPRRDPRERRPEGAAEEGRQPGIPQGDRPFREPRAEGDRGPRRDPRPEGDRGPRREDRPRIQIEPVVIPVQAPIGFWASLKRKLASLFGVPNKAVFVPSGRTQQPHGERRGERSDRGQRGGRGRGEFRGEFRGGSRDGSRGGREGSRDGSRGGRGEFRGDRGPRNGPREG